MKYQAVFRQEKQSLVLIRHVNKYIYTKWGDARVPHMRPCCPHMHKPDITSDCVVVSLFK